MNLLDDRTPEEISRIQVAIIEEYLRKQEKRPLKRVTPILDLLGGK